MFRRLEPASDRDVRRYAKAMRAGRVPPAVVLVVDNDGQNEERFFVEDGASWPGAWSVANCAGPTTGPVAPGSIPHPSAIRIRMFVMTALALALAPVAALAAAGTLARGSATRPVTLPEGLRVHVARPYVSPRERPLTPSEAWVREVAYGLKVPERWAIEAAAAEMARSVPVGLGGRHHPHVLVPVPASSGSVAANAALAAAIARRTGGRVRSLLGRAAAVAPSHVRHRAGLSPLSEAQHRMLSTGVPQVPVVYLVDNVLTSGNTLRAARAALGAGEGLVWASHHVRPSVGSRAAHRASPQEFGELTFESAAAPGWSLTWSWEGEGLSGDYEPDDPDDVPVLRATLARDREIVDDGSYATLAPTWTPRWDLERMSELLLARIADEGPRLLDRGAGRIMERWTWETTPIPRISDLATGRRNPQVSERDE
jgi:hypothetical protein